MTAALRTLVALVILGTSVGVARAEPEFRFWSLWTGADGTWRQEQGNPDVLDVPAEAVLGWSFIRSSGTARGQQAPRVAARFDELCPDGAEGPGTPVAVVIDYGAAADAPAGETPPTDRVACVTVPDPATPTNALAAAAEIRLGEEGLICGIDGYPAQECAAVAVTTADPATTTSPPPSDGPPAWIYSLALLVLIGGGYALSVRRRR